jgi:hypothetical protein
MDPMAWMTAIREHSSCPPSAQCAVLLSLALRMDQETGAGLASAGQLADDAQCDERTVRRATGWARKAGMLEQSTRGHRLGDGRAVASEWRLVMPQADGARRSPDPATDGGTSGPTVGSSTGQASASTGQPRHLNRTGEPGRPPVADIRERLALIDRHGLYQERAPTIGEHQIRIEAYGQMRAEGLWTAGQRDTAIEHENKLWKRRSRG